MFWLFFARSVDQTLRSGGDFIDPSECLLFSFLF
jgi:hypothetical protein